MPIYPGRRAGTWRVTWWTRAGQREKVVEGLKRDAKRFEHQQQALASDKVARRAPTFADFSIDLYEPYAKAQFGANTWRRNRQYVVARLVKHFGPTRLDMLHPTQLEGFRQKRLAEGRKPSSINAELKIFKAMLNWAEKDMHLPVARLRFRMLTVAEGRAKAWTLEQIARLYASLGALMPHLLPMVRFLLNTGLRKGEAVAAEWSWVDWADRMLRVPVNDYWKPKSGKPREVPLPDAVVEMLSKLPRSSPYVFLATHGGPFAEFPQKQFTEARRAAELPGSPHWTRHTFASHFLRARPDLGLLAKVLGHSTTRTTLLYAHMLPGHMDQARGAVSL